jgi:hypothetical protein
MALPKLETPTYELILPSTGHKILYRPFLVKEYKILLTSLESESSEISRIVLELIDACTFNKINIRDLSNFDTEFIFLNLRARSVGEIANLTLKCTNCSHTMDYELDITKASIKKDPDHTNKIKITDKIWAEMRYPKFDEIMEIYKNFNNDKIVGMLCDCIQRVYTEDQYYEEFTKEELIEFVNSFSKEQFERLEKFFLTMPKVYQEIHKVCDNCSHENKVTLEGLQNFFV